MEEERVYGASKPMANRGVLPRSSTVESWTRRSEVCALHRFTELALISEAALRTRLPKENKALAHVMT